MSRHGRRGSIWDYTAASSGGIYRVIKSASGWSLTRKGTQLRSLANGLLATDEFPPRLSSGRGLPKSLLNDRWLEGRAFEALLSDGNGKVAVQSRNIVPDFRSFGRARLNWRNY